MKNIFLFLIGALTACSTEVISLGNMDIKQIISSECNINHKSSELEYKPRENANWTAESQSDWITFESNKGVANTEIQVNIDVKAEAIEGEFTITYSNGTVEKVKINRLKTEEREHKEVVMMQFNIWQEGSSIIGGYEAIISEISHIYPDFITFSEVRNYNNVDFIAKLIADLKAKGKVYYSAKSQDSGLLSRYPISKFETIFPLANDSGSIYKLITEVNGAKFAVYTAHLDYKNYASFLPRGYDGASFAQIDSPVTDLEVIKTQNLTSMRDDAIKLFIDDAKKECDAGSLILLGGDFNEPSHLDWGAETKDLYDHNGVVYNWDVSIMLQNAGFIDTYRQIYKSAVTHPGFTYPSDNVDVEDIGRLSWAPNADERDRIDFIYYYPNPKLALQNSVVYGPSGSIVKNKRVEESGEDKFILPLALWPTDHKGVISTFKLYLD